MPRTEKTKAPPLNMYDDRPVRLRPCDSPGCSAPGDYRAPKQRDTDARDAAGDFYWFCLDHVREYNRNWDYFAGMSPEEIEDYIRHATVWDRPSWPLGEWQKREQAMRDKVMRDFFGAGGNVGGDGPFHNQEQASHTAPPMPTVEREALAMLELMPPVDFPAIKAQYRLLVKRYHPDANNGSRVAEERFKSITLAFTVLKEMYVVSDSSDV